MSIHSSTGDILLDLTLVIHNLIISYDTAHYHSIRLNVAIYWIIYVVECFFRSIWLPVVIVISNRYWQFWYSVG